MKKQTAVDWLEDKIQSDMTFMEILGLINQAKAMEKAQIREAYLDGIDNKFDNKCATSEEYYNETFRS